MREYVGVDDHGAALLQEVGDERLAAGDVAGEADEEHVGTSGLVD